MSTYDPDWPPRRETTFSGYPDFERYGLFRNEPPEPKPDLKEVTDEELGAEPIANGPTAANHLAYCKKRALSQLPDEGLVMSSLIQDFMDDPRTAGSADVVRELMLPLTLIGEFSGPGGPAKLRKFVLDFR